ncbi:hypothetical protein G7Y89_g2 [Cudoniella acicularis]|uniref:Uncharacterized protein n=1 Tax=Cudoniella acicularis TaxID=354080 RepID=A0A8H4WAT3_9HELO|nr:hypothetical protein G7Y89_g2 [Cudoniella acicularis]
MAGVRGFSDPNVQVNSDGKNTFQQKVTPALSTKAQSLLPYYINYLGGNWTESTQCTGAGSNSFQANHACLNNDLNNLWAANNTPTSWAHFRRQDIPVHFSIAESWTVADMYQASLDEVFINCPGGPQNPDQGGAVLDNNGTPGCEAPGFACFPFSWKTVPEFHQAAGVTWQVYQDVDNFGDDALSSFVQYQNAGPNDPLTTFGNSYPGLAKFYSDARAGTLPQVSWIVGPAELSEHVPYLPRDGAWLQKQIVDAVVHGAAYNKTGGWGDHVTPFHSPSGTAGEWLNVENSVFGYLGQTYTGPDPYTATIESFRVPFSIISPWTRGGNVFTEHADHNSQIMFVEQWLQALGYNGTATDQMPAWRRAHMSNLLNAFDFDHPDFTIPKLVEALTPSEDSNGNWDAASICQGKYGNPPTKPPAPFGPDNENSDPSKLSEEGYKAVRGYLTEGRYLVFEMNGFALTAVAGSNNIIGTKATADHRSKSQRWVLHSIGGSAVDGGKGAGTFVLTSAVDGRYLTSQTSLDATKAAAGTYTIMDLRNGKGYSMMNGNGKYLSLDANGTITPVQQAQGFQLFKQQQQQQSLVQNQQQYVFLSQETQSRQSEEMPYVQTPPDLSTPHYSPPPYSPPNPHHEIEEEEIRPELPPRLETSQLSPQHAREPSAQDSEYDDDVDAVSPLTPTFLSFLTVSNPSSSNSPVPNSPPPYDHQEQDPVSPLTPTFSAFPDDSASEISSSATLVQSDSNSTLAESNHAYEYEMMEQEPNVWNLDSHPPPAPRMAENGMEARRTALETVGRHLRALG